ncbi:MAG TPA: hypothetical protein VMF57_00580 [Solirubrobacteraceae bacterium]|nr:hypothetical protein [Solirubrobacteraceae bacterium]
MPRVFFAYFLRDPGAAHEFGERIEADVKPAALGEESVLSWNLHRSVDWPGSSENRPDFVCVVDVTDLRAWSDGASDSIAGTHGGLADLVKRIAMTVTVETGG